jgi:hypothetical protein
MHTSRMMRGSRVPKRRTRTGYVLVFSAATMRGLIIRMAVAGHRRTPSRHQIHINFLQSVSIWHAQRCGSHPSGHVRFARQPARPTSWMLFARTDVLLDAVHERPIEIGEKRWAVRERALLRRLGSGRVPTASAANMLEWRRSLEEDARKQLEALIPEDARPWCDPETIVGYGKASREI